MASMDINEADLLDSYDTVDDLRKEDDETMSVQDAVREFCTH
jgi:hypothetical protein